MLQVMNNYFQNFFCFFCSFVVQKNIKNTDLDDYYDSHDFSFILIFILKTFAHFALKINLCYLCLVNQENHLIEIIMVKIICLILLYETPINHT